MLVFRSRRKTTAQGDRIAQNGEGAHTDQYRDSQGLSRGPTEMRSGKDTYPEPYKRAAEMSSGMDPNPRSHKSVVEIGPTTPTHEVSV